MNTPQTVTEQADEAGSVLSEEPARNEWVGIVLRTLLAVVVLGAGYVALAHHFGGRVPNGTTVQGVDISNLTPEAAAETLETRLALLTDDPVVFRVDGESYQLDPVQSGLSVDLPATLQGLTGVSYDPRVLWSRITDEGGELTLVLVVDHDVLERSVAEHASDFDADPVEGRVWLSLGDVHVIDPEPGRSLDPVATADRVADGWPHTRTVEGVSTEVPAELTTEEIARFVTEEAEPALASSVVVQVGEEQTTVTPNQLSRLLTVEESEDHTLSLALDEETLVEIVRGGLTDAVTPARDAAVRLGDNGQPEVVPARVGTELDEDSIIAAVREALTSDDPQERVVEVDTVDVEPELHTEVAEGWRMEVMAEFRSEFPTGPANEARTHNIQVGLGHINGTVVMPGEQFSLAQTLSPINADRGYVEAGVIIDGRLVQGMGGGLSQVSTTVLNTAWSSAVQLDEFTPHSYWIPRYPVGREATLAVGVIDNKWTNDTPEPIIMQSWIEGDEIVMRFWGDRRYTVETITGPWRNIVQPGVSEDDSEDCLPQRAQEGFDITVTRVLSRGGEEVSRQSYNTRYQPSDAITCTHPNARR